MWACFFFFMLLLLLLMSWNDKVQDGAILSTDNANLLCRTTLNNLRNCYFTKRVDGKCVNTLDSVSSLSAKLLRTQTDINSFDYATCTQKQPHQTESSL